MTRPNTMTAEEYRRQTTGRKFGPDQPKRPKYRNEKTVVDGLNFDSKREASRYLELKMAEKHGRIRNLKLQYVYPIVIDGVYVTTYTADFVYEELVGGEWQPVTEDAKGYPNETYPIRKRLMKAVYGIEVRES